MTQHDVVNNIISKFTEYFMYYDGNGKDITAAHQHLIDELMHPSMELRTDGNVFNRQQFLTNVQYFHWVGCTVEELAMEKIDDNHFQYTMIFTQPESIQYDDDDDIDSDAEQDDEIWCPTYVVGIVTIQDGQIASIERVENEKIDTRLGPPHGYVVQVGYNPILTARRVSDFSDTSQ